MKSYPPFLLLPLLMFILVFEWFWLGDRSPVVAPASEEKAEAKPARVAPAATEVKGKPNQAEEKKTTDANDARD